MRHGDLHPESMDAYLLLESVFCDCDALCECGFDDEAPKEGRDDA